MCSNVTFGVIVLALYGFLPVFTMEDCTSSASTIRVQTSCKQEDEDLTQAHADEDNLKICRKMAVMFKCAVTSLPRCYDYFEASTFSMYFHSPFSCDLSVQQIMELQDIHNRGTDLGAVTASSSPPPVMETSYSTSTATSTQDNEEVTYSTSTSLLAATQQWLEEETVAGRSGGRTATSPNKSDIGRNEEQKGSLSNNGAVMLRRLPFMFLVVGSRTLSWRLTS